ncbi:MAG: zinc metallopeptidase [Clostridia bacterium]|nr:zinc metallopeptidase [Clostridia bacterium]
MASYFLYHSSFLIMIPFMILAMLAQSRVKSTYRRYLNVRSYRGMTGREVAEAILVRNGINDVTVEMVGGIMSDHYDPRSKKVRLSQAVYSGSSIAALSIAAHEVGHAMQHANGYVPLSLRTAILPVASFGSSSAFLFVFLGFFFNSGMIMDIGIWFFIAAVVFQFLTLPVEFNASSRAIVQLSENNFLYEDEVVGAKRMLNAAAMTYVAATAVAIGQLIRLIVLRNSRD